MAGVAGGALVMFLLNQFVCGDEASAPPSVAQEKTVQQQAAPGPAKAAGWSSSGIPRDRGRQKTVKFATWGRSPFAEAHRLVKFDSTRVDSNDFVLRGIIWQGNEAHVLIGDEILKEGERSGDLKILDIEKDRVVCKKGTKVVTLVLNDDKK